MEDLTIIKKELRQQTLMDVVLKQVCNYVNQGWPQDKARIPEQCVTFYEKRVTGSILGVLLTLHEGHPGFWAMLALS